MFNWLTAEDIIGKRKTRFLLQFVDSDNLLCNVFCNMANKALVALANWYTLLRIRSLCWLRRFWVDSIAHALLRCDFTVSNYWYICPMGVCCLQLLFLCFCFFIIAAIYVVNKDEYKKTGCEVLIVCKAPQVCGSKGSKLVGNSQPMFNFKRVHVCHCALCHLFTTEGQFVQRPIKQFLCIKHVHGQFNKKCSAVAETGDRLATIDFRWKLGAAQCAPLIWGGGGTGSYLAQRGLGQGLPPCQVPSWSIQQFDHNRHLPKIRGRSATFFGRSWVHI